MKKIILAVFLLTVLFVGCRHTQDEMPKPVLEAPPCCAKFDGTYNVYDTANSINYIMKISHFSVTNHNGGVEDTIVVENFANKFDLKFHFTCGLNTNIFAIYPPFPSYDHNNKRWGLFYKSDDTTTTIIENELKNDSIVLYFTMDNIAFYSPDGVPYFSGNLKHIAVKQH